MVVFGMIVLVYSYHKFLECGIIPEFKMSHLDCWLSSWLKPQVEIHQGLLLNLFNWWREEAIPRFLFSSSSYHDRTCYGYSFYFQPLERWKSNNNIETMLVINLFYLKIWFLPFSLLKLFVVVRRFIWKVSYNLSIISIARKTIGGHIMS